jgi:hypothetical protein
MGLVTVNKKKNIIAMYRFACVPYLIDIFGVYHAHTHAAMRCRCILDTHRGARRLADTDTIDQCAFSPAVTEYVASCDEQLSQHTDLPDARRAGVAKPWGRVTEKRAAADM